jgi:hypothetical protein
LVVACVALFAAIGGGAYAASANSVKSRHIADNEIRSADIKNGTIKRQDLDVRVRTVDLRKRLGPGEYATVVDGTQTWGIRVQADSHGACLPPTLVNGGSEGPHDLRLSIADVNDGQLLPPSQEPYTPLVAAGGSTRFNVADLAFEASADGQVGTTQASANQCQASGTVNFFDGEDNEQ